MIFYGNGSVWDSRKSGTLCRFVNGECEVSKETDISYLIRLGYKHEPIDYGDNMPVEIVKVTEPIREPLVEDKPKRKYTKAVKDE